MRRIAIGKCNKAGKILRKIDSGLYENLDELKEEMRIQRNKISGKIKKRQAKIELKKQSIKI